MKRKRKMIMSVMLCILLFAAMFVVPVFTNVIEPVSENVRAEEEEPDIPIPPDEPIPPKTEGYNLTLTNISAHSASSYPEIIFVNTLTYVDFTFTNKGEKYITDVKVNVYEVKFYPIEPEEGNLTEEPYTTTETYLTTLYYGNFLPSYEKTKTVTWTPTQTGEYELKLNISYYEGSTSNKIVYEDGATFCVARDDLPITEMSKDWIIDKNVTMVNMTIIVNGDLVITKNGNLTLQGCYLRPLSIDIWGVSIWIDAQVDVHCANRGEDHLWVHETGTLLVMGSTIFNFLPLETYHFWVDGILICTEWEGQWTWIMHVWGEDNGEDETGGIELRNNNPQKQSEFTWTFVIDCDTIGIGCYGSSPHIDNVATLFCGSRWGTGKGIYVEGATANPQIERSWLIWNGFFIHPGCGIKLKNVGSATIFQNWIWGNTYTGVFLDSSSSQVTIDSNFIFLHHNIWWVGCGILCYRSSSTIIRNTIFNNDHGIIIFWTPSPSVDDNTIIWNIWLGIYVDRASPIIQNNVISHNDYAGIYMWHSSATIQNNMIELNGLGWDDNMGGIYGFYSTPTIENNDIISNDGWGIWMQYGAPWNEDDIGNANNYIPNNDEGRVWQQWWLQVFVIDLITGEPIENAWVEVEDGFNNPIWQGFTGPDGMTARITVTEYQIDNLGNNIPFTPHLIEVTFEDRNAEQGVVVDDNLVTLVLLP